MNKWGPGMLLRSIVLAVVVIFLSLPLPLFGSSAIASPVSPLHSSAAPSAITLTLPSQAVTNLVSSPKQLWSRAMRWLPDVPHAATAAPRPVASMSYPVKRAIPRILNSLMQTIVQCFRQFLWIATRQMQNPDYQWQIMDVLRPESNLWSIRSEG